MISAAVLGVIQNISWSKDYNVEAIDGSAELCKLASEYTGIKVRNIFFQNLSEVDKYDGKIGRAHV